MTRQHVKISEHGRVIGEDHPLAKLCDFEVDEIRERMDLHDELVARLSNGGWNQRYIRDALRGAGLTIVQIASDYKVSAQYVWMLHNGSRRAQSCAGHKEVK